MSEADSTDTLKHGRPSPRKKDWRDAKLTEVVVVNDQGGLANIVEGRLMFQEAPRHQKWTVAAPRSPQNSRNLL